jgi:MFS family permease
MSTTHNSNFRWYILGLSFLSSAFVSAIPYACMPVLFEEIRVDLGLSLVQLGTIWGMVNLAAIFVSLIAGLLGDRFGARIILGLSCILVGITGALRGFSNSFLMLAIMVFANGLARSIIPINMTKLIAIWFKNKNLGLANSIGSMGMGFGTMMAPMISATILSPWLGGWRNVMFFYGAMSAAVGSLWFLFAKTPKTDETTPSSVSVPLKVTIAKMIRNKAVWLVGLTITFRMAGIQGMTGYLPLYLTNRGWSEASAGGVLSLFYAMSTAGVIPLAALSDRIGRRKSIILIGVVITALSLGLIPVIGDWGIWVIIVISGLFMDAVMAILMTILLESKGIELSNAGIALGIAFSIGPIGSAIAPALGNSLAKYNDGLPFIFWAGFSVASIITVLMIKETGWRKKRNVSKAYQQPSSTP